jgi:hypothetical protein
MIMVPHNPKPQADMLRSTPAIDNIFLLAGASAALAGVDPAIFAANEQTALSTSPLRNRPDSRTRSAYCPDKLAMPNAHATTRPARSQQPS